MLVVDGHGFGGGEVVCCGARDGGEDVVYIHGHFLLNIERVYQRRLVERGEVVLIHCVGEVVCREKMRSNSRFVILGGEMYLF